MNDTSISIFKCKGDYLQTKSRDVYRTTLPTFQSQEKTREIHIDGISQNTLKPNQTLVILYKTDCDISGVDLKDSNLVSFPKQQKHGLNVLNPKDHPIFLTFLGFLVAYCLTNLLHIPLSFLSINYRLLIYALNTFLLVLPSIFYCHRYKIDYKKVYRLNLRAVTFYTVIRSLLFNVYIIFFYYLAALLMLKQEVIATRPLIVLDFGNVGEIVYVFITVILVPAFCQGIYFPFLTKLFFEKTRKKKKKK
ncbi:hypothetical protein M0812_22703 [Anaeramoeba flamelloides]|uniref:Uncharacterized protein n=1 Tax=Anaeramoeba flamelloides TaxID=1746091 RepID=A0AAV7YV56_9EUKA|nr:hypothetical protein M0812_22703 [Anaeramoeba flamelloides]